MVPTGPYQFGPAIDGSLTASPVRFSIMAAALLFVSTPWTPHPCNTLTVCSGYPPGALEGGGGARQGIRHTPSPRVAQSHGCGPLGGILALRAHCALLLDYVPPEEPLGTPLGNALRIR